MLLDGENFEDPTKNILFLLSSMIGNPVALYYSNLTCCASTTQDLSDFVFEKNVEKYKPDIVTRFEYKKQRKEHTQYITKIHVLGGRSLFGSHGSEYAINNTGLYGIGKCCFYFTV